MVGSDWGDRTVLGSVALFVTLGYLAMQYDKRGSNGRSIIRLALKL
jgi:hypothetical protein